MRRTAIILALAVGLLGLGTLPALALGKFICAPAGRAQIDPIAYHSQAQSPHNHLFFGNKALTTSPDPEYANLVGAGATCDNPDDTAGYWVPDLVWTSGPLAGQSVQAKRMFAYYRAFDHRNTGFAEPIPPDLRVVVGNPAQPAGTQQDTKIVNWSCDERSTHTGPYPNLDAADCGAASGTVYATTHIDTPTCWDGQYGQRGDGNTSDNAHLRHVVGGTCPAGFDHRIAELRMTVKWGDGTAAFWRQGSVALASDVMQRDMGNPVAAGQTLHGDFWNTWVQTGGAHGGMEGMVRSCIVSPSKPGWCNA